MLPAGGRQHRGVLHYTFMPFRKYVDPWRDSPLLKTAQKFRLVRSLLLIVLRTSDNLCLLPKTCAYSGCSKCLCHPHNYAARCAATCMWLQVRFPLFSDCSVSGTPLQYSPSHNITRVHYRGVKFVLSDGQLHTHTSGQASGRFITAFLLRTRHIDMHACLRGFPHMSPHCVSSVWKRLATTGCSPK